MYHIIPLNFYSGWLTASNVVYVAGAVMTLGAAVHVLIEKRAVLAGKRAKESFWAEASVVIAAAVCVLGTLGAIFFGTIVSHLKDADLAEYKKQADIQIAQADSNAKDSLNKAVAAQLAIDRLTPTVSTLQTAQTQTTTSVKTLESRTSQRHISIGAKDLNLLKTLNDTFTFFELEQGFEEPGKLEHELAVIFQSAGLRADISTVMGVSPSSLLNVPGLHIRYESTADGQKLANALGQLFKENKIAFDSTPFRDNDIEEFQRESSWTASTNRVIIYIGKKP